jgi:GT2 family glycosyltransferase
MSARQRVAIVVLNYNGLDDTVRCLRSIASIEYPDLDVVLVDNASDIDPRVPAENEYPDLVFIRNRTNLGYAGGNNRGIEAALSRGAQYVLVLNNDTVVAPSIVRTLVDTFSFDATLGIVGPVINYMDEPDRVMTEGVRFNTGPGPTFFARQAVPTGDPAPPVVTVDIVNGCCMMISAAVFHRVGVFDERLFIVHEESDLCLRAGGQRFRCAVVGSTLVWHKGSSSFERAGRRIQRYYDTRNLHFLLRRHAGRTAASRPRIKSWWPFLKYAFYRYAIEIEHGKRAAADAVIDGLWDGLAGRTGMYSECTRLGVPALRAAFEVGRRFGS